MMEEDNIEIFDQFLEGSLSSEEEGVFKKRLEEDSQFKEAYEAYKLIASGIAFAGADDLKQRLVEQEKQYHIKESTKSSGWLYKIAAGLVILAVASYILFSYSGQTDYNGLYNQFYEPYPNVIDPINRSQDNENLSVYQLYEQQKYDEAISILKNNREEISEDDRFYLGQSYLAIKDYSEALQNLAKIDSNSRFYEAAQWYTALIYVYQEDKEQSDDQLKKIIRDGGSYKSKAKDLQEGF